MHQSAGLHKRRPPASHSFDTMPVMHKKPLAASTIINSNHGVAPRDSLTLLKWQRIPFVSTKPPPSPPQSLDDATYLPETTVSFYSLTTFGWITPLLCLGYVHPLEATDLYKLPPDRGASHISDLITNSFLRRIQQAEKYNERLVNGEIGPGIKGIWWSVTGKREEKEREWKEKTGKRKASLVWAMNDSVKWWFWSGGCSSSVEMLHK